MPQAEFSEANKVTSALDLNRLTLKQNEKARLLLLNTGATWEFVHTIRTVTVAGKPRFRRYFCLGARELLNDNKADPQRCPLCAAASTADEAPISPVTRRYAICVARYHTNMQGMVQQPPSLEFQVWEFAQEKYNMLCDRGTTHGDLRAVDIILHCTAETFQKYDMDVDHRVAIQGNQPALVVYADLVRQANATDLMRRLGQEISYEKALEAVRDAMGGPPPSAAPAVADAPSGFAQATVSGAFNPDALGDDEEVGALPMGEEDDDVLPAISATPARLSALLE